MISNITARATPHEKTPLKIAKFSQPIIPLFPLPGLIADPQDRLDGVVVGGWKAVLRRQPVVHGDEHGRDRGGHAST